MLLTEVFIVECSNLCSEMCLIMHIENVTKQLLQKEAQMDLQYLE